MKRLHHKLEKVVMGVPQGSIFGPLFICCYLKNMASSPVADLGLTVVGGLPGGLGGIWTLPWKI